MLRDRKTRIRKLANLRDEITLVPYSGIQTLDFGFDINALDIRPFRFIPTSDLDRIAGITKIDKVRSLDDASTMNVQTGDHAFC